MNEKLRFKLSDMTLNNQHLINSNSKTFPYQKTLRIVYHHINIPFYIFSNHTAEKQKFQFNLTSNAS